MQNIALVRIRIDLMCTHCMYKRDVTVLNAAHLVRMGMAKSTGKWICIKQFVAFVKSGLKANKAGQRDTAAEFSTVPPKSGRLTPMYRKPPWFPDSICRH